MFSPARAAGTGPATEGGARQPAADPVSSIAVDVRRVLADLAAKGRQFMGIVMLVVATPAIVVGVLEWRRQSDKRVLAAMYALAGVYLAFEGIRLVLGKRK